MKRFRKKRWHAPFLEAVASYGQLTAAAKLVPITRSLVYRELEEHPEFRRQLQDALERHRDNILLRITTIAMDPNTPKHLSLAGLEYLLERADRRLDRETERAVANDQPQQNTLIINVDSETARSLLAKPAWALPASVNGNGSNGLNGSTPH
jgi:hypothetical protein